MPAGGRQGKDGASNRRAVLRLQRAGEKRLAARARADELLARSGADLVAAFRAAVAAGMPADEAARLAGMSKQAIYQLAKRLGLED